jgi:four helix bundle protein
MNQLRIKNYELRTFNYELKITDIQLRIKNYELRTFNYELKITDEERSHNSTVNNYELRMKRDNIIQQKTFAFAIRIVNVYKYLSAEKREFVLSKQLLRSGTSIGANIEESIGGQSDRDFIFKVSIAYKEARESVYWLKLLQATDYLTIEESESLLADAEEICKILGKIQITIKSRNS